VQSHIGRMTSYTVLLKGQCHETFCFKCFRKFAEIFASQGAPPVSTTEVANLPPVSTTPAANFSTSFASVVDTGGKFATGVNDTSKNLPPVSTTLVANCHWYQQHRRQICHRCQ
jgi:hypothetical protein